MRIAYVLTTLGIGGAERQALALAERIAARGHAVALIVLGPPVPEEWPSVLPVVHLSMRKSPAGLLITLASTRKFLAGFRPDLIHSHTFHANIFARLLKVLAPSQAVSVSAPPQVVSTVHNVYEGPWPRMLAYRLTDRLSRRTMCVSQAVADRYIRLKAVPAAKCFVLPNGIDTVEFAPSPARRETMRSELSAHSDFIWLTAGRLSPSKDYPNLLRAFALVHAQAPNARLLIAGQATVAQLSAMQALTAELGLQESVRWLGLRRDLPALLDAADAFVLASAWEGMPLAAAEAMAMQKPLVATSAGGTRELVAECGNRPAPKIPRPLPMPCSPPCTAPQTPAAPSAAPPASASLRASASMPASLNGKRSTYR